MTPGAPGATAARQSAAEMPQTGDTRPDGLAWRQTTGAISVERYIAAVSRIRRRIEAGTTLTH